MPIFIVLATVLVVAALVFTFYPKKSTHSNVHHDHEECQTQHAYTHTSIDEEPEIQVVVAPVITVEHKEEKKKEAPKMKAKPKKKPQPKKKPAKKTNA